MFYTNPEVEVYYESSNGEIVIDESDSTSSD